MRKPYALAEIQFGMKADPLGDWLSRLQFEPRAFGHQRDDPRATCSTRVIGDFEMILVLGGESRITIGPELLVCHAGDLVLIPPFTPHAIDTPPENPHHNYWMHFDVGPAHLQPQFLAAVRPLTARRTPLRDPAALQQVLEMLERELVGGKPGFQAAFRAALIQAVLFVFREMDADALPASGAFPDQTRREWVRRCTEYLLATLNEAHTGESLATRYHISESTLRKAFSAEMGMSPHLFLQMARVRQAEKWMLTTGMTLEEIAAEVGLSSAHYLNMAFKRFYHVSPREWRNSQPGSRG